MSTINTTTGHSPRGERKVARILYVCIALAVIVGVILFIVLGGGSNQFNPYKTDQPNATAPDVPPGQNPQPLEAPAEPPPPEGPVQ